MTKRLVDEVALITGSTKGIGRAMALRFAAEGAKVVVTGRTPEIGRQVVDRITEAGGEATFIRTDVCQERDVEAAVEAALAEYGKLTVFVNNAVDTSMVLGATPVDGTVVDLPTDRWNSLMTMVLTSVFWGCKYSMPALARSGGGSIVNISSIGSLLGTAGNAAYSAAKAAVNSLTRSVAVEGAAQGIRCNCIVSGVIAMKGRDDGGPQRDALFEGEFGAAMRELQLTRFGEPTDIANLAAFLASREAGFLTGLILPADGGATAKLPIPPASVLASLFAQSGS